MVHLKVTQVDDVLVKELVTWTGFWSVRTWMSSRVCLMIRHAISFFPLFLPCFMRVHASLSTMGHCTD